MVVQATNPLDDACESVIALRAPGFELAPLKEEQKIALPPKGKGSLAWILTPHKTGSFQVVVTDILDTRVFGVTVTNVLGLNTFQAQLLTAIGGLFGPIFTIPWWLEKWQQRRERQARGIAAPFSPNKISAAMLGTRYD